MTTATNIISKSTARLILVCALAFTSNGFAFNYDPYAEYDPIYNPYQFNAPINRDDVKLANGQHAFLQEEDREAATFCQELQYSPDKAQDDYIGRNERDTVTFRGHQWRYMPNPLGDDERLYFADPWDATPWDECAEGNTLEHFGYLTRDQYGVWVNEDNASEMVLGFNGTMPHQWADNIEGYSKDDYKADMLFASGFESNSRACRTLNTYVALAGKFPEATFTLTGHSLGGRMAIFLTNVIKKQRFTKSTTRFTLSGLPKERIVKSFAFNPHLLGVLPDYVVELARSSRVGEACELRIVSNIGEYASKGMYATYGELVCQVETEIQYERTQSLHHYIQVMHALHNITPENWRGPWTNGASKNNGYRSFYRGYRHAIGLEDDSQDWIDAQPEPEQEEQEPQQAHHVLGERPDAPVYPTDFQKQQEEQPQQ